MIILLLLAIALLLATRVTLPNRCEIRKVPTMNSCKLNAVVLNLLDQYLSSGAWTEARQLSTDDRFKDCCQQDPSEIVNLLISHLTPETFQAAPDLFHSAELLLKAASQLAPAQDMVMEFVEQLGIVQDDNVLIALMKSLKIVLLRLPEKRSLSLEWCLTSLHNYFKRLPIGDQLERSLALEKCPFLENDPQIDRILQLHLILLLFLEPLVQQVVEQRLHDHTTRTLENTRQNVLIHFLLNMLETPLNRIYIPFVPAAETNTYLRQCRETLTNMLTRLLASDPFYLLPFIEQRARHPLVVDEEHPTDLRTMNVFLLPEKVPIVAFGQYFHTLLVHEVAPVDTPKVYRGDYILVKALYLVLEMLKVDDENVQMKGIELGHKLTLMTGSDAGRNDEYLELNLFESFFDRLIQLMTFSEGEAVRRAAVKFGEAVILSFNHRGRLVIVENLFRGQVGNRGVCGYLPILYKNMVADALKGETENEVAEEYKGAVFKRMLLRYICVLPEGEKTNLLEHSDRIMAALNFILFLVLRDRTNRTGFCDLRGELEAEFLDKLRLAIDMSRAHYVQYKKSIEMGVEEVGEEKDICLAMYGKEMPELSQEQKLVAMNNCLNSFDLMESLLARVNDCMQEAGRRERGV